MKLRHTKKYKEENTNTKRLYNSAIPYMQRILNKENKETKNIVGKFQMKKT